MVTVFDKYIVQEGLNGVFSHIENSEIVSRPSQEGFESNNFFVCKRPGLFTKKNNNNTYMWKTEGSILESKTFNSKEYLYTSEGYVYSFDGDNLIALPTNPLFIQNVTQNTDIILNKTADLEYTGQEVTIATTLLVNSLKFRLKKNVGSIDTSYINAYIATSADKNTPLVRSLNTIYSTELTTSYVTYTFNFPAFKLVAGTKHFIYLDGGNTSTTSQILVNANTTDVYGGASVTSFTGTNAMVWSATTGDLWFELAGTAANSINTTLYDENILNVNYVSGVRYPDAITQLDVNVYNPATLTITTVQTTLNSTYIGKYVYISAGKGIYQQRSIIDIPANNQIVISSDFNVVPDGTSDLIFFTGITEQLWFTQIRKGATAPDLNFCLSIDENGVTKWIYMPERRQLQFWDNRIVQLTKDNQALLYSSNIDYEIPILQKSDFGNSKALSFAPYGPYLIIYFKNKIGLVKKDIIDASTGTFAYLYQDILDLGAYSAYSYKVSKGQLIVQQSDGQVYSVDLSTVSFGEIQAKPVILSEAIETELSKLVGGDTRIFYDKNNIKIVWRGTSSSKVFKYYEKYKGWIIDYYAIGGNFHEFFYRVGNRRFTGAGNTLFEIGGLQDDGVDYTQRIKLYGPVEGEYSTTTTFMGVAKMGFDGQNRVGGSVKFVIGGNTMIKKEYDFTKLDVVTGINGALEQDGTLGTGITGEYIYGGANDVQQNIFDYYPEIFYVSVGLYKKGQHYTLDLINTEAKQMYFGGLNLINNTESQLVTSNKSRA